jgi:pyruvate dehydrogenase E2 component (dihydrolipoamide acetyltransferase)
MPTEVIMPMLGMAQETGKLLRWLKAEGDQVRRGEPVMEIETDKVTVEIEAPADGMLAALSVDEGDEVPVGTVVALLVAEGESLQPTRSPESADSTPLSETPRRQRASPKARRLADELGVDIDRVVGSGPHGTVSSLDVTAAAASTASLNVDVIDVDVPRLMPVSLAWQRMAVRSQRSWQEIPQFALTRECDARAMKAWYAEASTTTPANRAPTYTDLLVAACSAALREHPRVNASWREGTIVGAERVNIGLAVATADTLVVPVVHDADQLNLDAITARRAVLVQRAHDGSLEPHDVAGATFTISNLGMFGVDAFHAIVSAPQAAILAVGRIADRVWAESGVAAVLPTVVLTVSFDHRVVDGAMGARFLTTIAEYLEEPAPLIR